MLMMIRRKRPVAEATKSIKRPVYFFFLLVAGLLLASMSAAEGMKIRGKEVQEGEEEKANEKKGSNSTTTKPPGQEDPAPALRVIPCSADRASTDCDAVEGAYCNLDTLACTCKPDFPVTDTHNCYKESRYDEFCRIDLQCQREDKNTRCNTDLNVCQCQFRYEAKAFGSKFWCAEATRNVNTAVGSYFNPTLFGIMGGLVLMFIVMCVVLQLFAKAQFRENRTIFNTPNPRLMNVSLMKDNAAKDRKSSNSENEQRKKSCTTSGAGAGASGSGAGGGAAEDDEDKVFIEIRDDD